MPTFLIATRNAHKVGEIRALLGGEFSFLTLRDFPAAPAAIEDAPDFAGNALKKSVGLAAWLTTQPSSPAVPDWVLADDSGLEVDALNGAPGVFSARFAALDTGEAGNSPDAANNAKLVRLLAAVPAEKRTARFRCVIALTPVGKITSEEALTKASHTFDGTCEGRIASGYSGEGGFGYDPLFVPAGHTQSFAELGEAVKNQLSHRSHALQKLKQWWQVRK